MFNRKKASRISRVRKRTHEGVDNIMNKAENISESSREKVDYLKGKEIMMKENVDGYIQKKPKRSVLIAVGVGAVVGAIMAAVMMKRRQ